MKLVDVKVVKLVREIQNRPLLECVRLNLNDRAGQVAMEMHREWLDGDIRPGDLGDVKVGLAAVRPLVFGESKGASWHRRRRVGSFVGNLQSHAGNRDGLGLSARCPGG